MLVVLPAPLGPMNPKTWPRSTWKLTLSTALTLPNARYRFDNSIWGCDPIMAFTRFRE